MARVFGITLPAGVELIFNKTLKMYDITVACNIGKNRSFMTRQRKYNLREFQKLTEVAYAWSFLSQAQKDAWYTAADIIGMNGYALWTQDKIYRLVNGIGGNAVPSIYHQYKVGKIDISGAATEAEIKQHHVTACALPATMKISYKTDLTSAGADPYAKLIFRTLRFSGGQNISEDHEISIPLSSAWATSELIVSSLLGTMGEWDLIIKLNDVQGSIYFDNVFLEFAGEEQSWDSICEDVKKYWRSVSLPAGAVLSNPYVDS